MISDSRLPYTSGRVIGLLLFAFFFISTLGYESEALPPPSSPAPHVTAICRELESLHCTPGWVVDLVEGVYLAADSSDIQPEAWTQQKGRFTISGTILSYSSSQKSWSSTEASFLGCRNPTMNTSFSVFQGTTYLSCDRAVYAFRRFEGLEGQDGYTCLRFFFASLPKQLFWGCFEESPASGQMADLSIHESLHQDVESPYVRLTWTLTVQNDRVFHTDASDVTVTVDLPLDVTLHSATSSQGNCQHAIENSPAMVCSLGMVHSADTATIEIATTVDPNVHFGTLSVTAAVSDHGGTFDPLLDNNSSLSAATVESSGLLASPSCVAPGDSITLSGLTLDLASLRQDGVHIGEQPAKILAASSTGLVVEMPSLPDGIAPVIVQGIAGSASVTVRASCSVRSPSSEDVQAGFVAGEVLLFLKPGLSPQEIEQLKVDYGFQSLIEYPALGFYRAVLGDKPVKAYQEPSPVSCRTSKRDTAPETDLLLLVDRSGTMDEAHLKPLLVELGRQMYCLLSQGSRVSVMTYNNELKRDLAFAPWSTTQYEALSQWLARPLLPQSTSHLEEALTAALDSFQAAARPDVSKHILVVTRGPSLPPTQNAQAIIDRARQEGVTIQGLGMTDALFTPQSYRDLQDVAQATGRDVIFWAGQPWALSDVVMHTLVQGVYGVARCEGEDCLAQIPTIPANLPVQTTGVIELLNRDPRVDQAFSNDLIDTLQSDPHIGDQDWLLKLGLPQGWADFFPHQGAGVTMAVIDTGADLNLTKSASPELVLNPLAPEGLNFAPVPASLKQTLGQDDLGHGTAVSAIALAAIGNEVNGAGVAPRATLIPMKVFALIAGEVKASNEAVAKALMSAFSLGVDVINISLGCQGCSRSTESALRKYYEKVINNLVQKANQSKSKLPVIVAASGNDGEPWVDSPAAHPFVFAVGSIKPDFSGRSSFSNYGPELDFVAVGEDTETTVVGGAFSDAGSGTSFAAPQVAGLVALILGEEPGLSPDLVKDKIKECFTVDVEPPGFDEETGWGRIFIPSLREAKPECVKKK